LTAQPNPGARSAAALFPLAVSLVDVLLRVARGVGRREGLPASARAEPIRFSGDAHRRPSVEADGEQGLVVAGRPNAGGAELGAGVFDRVGGALTSAVGLAWRPRGATQDSRCHALEAVPLGGGARLSGSVWTQSRRLVLPGDTPGAMSRAVLATVNSAARTWRWLA
jgi:hypothetical protein